MKLLLINIILFTTFFTLANQPSLKPELSKKFRIINNLIIVDVKLAKSKIDSLSKQLKVNKKFAELEELTLNTLEYYKSTGNFPHMKYELFRALGKMSSKSSERFKLGINYYLAINHGIEGDKDKMLHLLKQTFSSAKKKHFYFLEAQCLSSLGGHFINSGAFKIGQDYLAKANTMYLKLQEYHANTAVRMVQGIGYYWEGNNEKAFKLFHTVLAYSQEKNLQKVYCQSLNNLAEAHLFTGVLDSSEYYYSKFLQIKDQADLRDLYQVYWGLEYFYNFKNNIDSAYHYSKLMHTVDDSLRSIMEADLGNDLELQFIENISKQRIDSKNREVKKQQDRNILLWSILLVAIILFTSILVLVVSSNRKKNKVNKLLSAQKKAIANKNSIIDSALKEKEILLKEIHHRVKNNLQVISSLLNLQSKSITDQHAIDVLEEGKERIQAIALIHHRLYQSEDFAYVAMEDYIPDLIYQLKRTYVNDQCTIESNIQINDIKLSLDTAVPLGLIICEMITNTFKHAFTGKSDGQLKISLIPGTERNHFELFLEDDGIGLREGLNFPEVGSLGAEIITALTEQLFGELKVSTSEKGTKFNLKFKDKRD